MQASPKRQHNDPGLGFTSLERELWRINWKTNGYPYCGVYVITTDSLYPCKIGISINPIKRLANLQTSHWRPLQISGYRWCESQADAVKVEAKAHDILTDEGKALLGEWFDVRVEKAVEAMEWAALTLNVALNKHIPNDDVNIRLALTRLSNELAVDAMHRR